MLASANPSATLSASVTKVIRFRQGFVRLSNSMQYSVRSRVITVTCRSAVREHEKSIENTTYNNIIVVVDDRI